MRIPTLTRQGDVGGPFCRLETMVWAASVALGASNADPAARHLKLFARDLLDEIARDLVPFASAVELHAKPHKGLESARNVPAPRIDKVDCRFARPPFRKDGHQKPALALRFDKEARKIGDALSGDGKIFEGPVVVRCQRGSKQDFRLRPARSRKVPRLQPRRAAKDETPVQRQFVFVCRLIVLCK